ncbi:MerC family mercury resistance protein [Dyella sp. LX-66]|uniref:MerC domain-containing protein n=1 Tax=unclassified Dyella TaxID=2634549 RepID=UPI001BE0A866|nr:MULTISPECIES: MerC domain-containing protein [unclassified Dyella]MBT2118181.1 MerC family mercury resistance protein [Dyella sp. LX-1]MBT2138793.1 MerC family mercury resistance protein [Dyella sp. LX-66]
MDQESKTRWWRIADRIGAMASFLCAIHCAALPFVLALLPLLGLDFLADHRFERAFVLFACVLALVSLLSGYRRHHRVLPLRLALPGLALLVLGVTVAEGYSVGVHSALVTCGGLLVAAAHFINLRADREQGHVHSVDCAH